MLDGRGNIEKEMINRSWNEMKSILDRELPVVNKSKRRFFWIFFFMLFGLSMGAWVVNSIYQQDKSSIADPIQIVDDSERLDSEKGIENRDLENSIQQYNSIEKNDNSSRTPALLSNNEEKLNFKVDESNAISENTNSTQPLHNESNNDLIVISTPIVEVQNINDNTFQSVTPPVIPIEARGKLMFPIIINKSLSVSNGSSLLLEDKILIYPVSSSSGFTAYLDSRVVEYQQFNFETGIGYEFNLKNRFLLFANIGYGIDSYKEETISANHVAERFIANTALETNLISSISSTVLDKGNYFGFKGGVKYPVSKRLNVLGGFQYRMYSNNSNSDQIDLAAAEDMTDPTQAGNMDHYQVIFENQNDLYLSFGLEYQLRARIYLNASYLQQINDAYKVNIVNYNLQPGQSLFSKRKEVRIGLTYKF